MSNNDMLTEHKGDKPEFMSIAEASQVAVSPEHARAALAAEWESLRPDTSTEDSVVEFYRHSTCLHDDLEAFHSDPERQRWTQIITHVADEMQATLTIDIGCGGGHDLRALRAMNPSRRIAGIEPNDALAQALIDDGFRLYPSVERAPIEDADLLVCIDVLEHVVNPEAWLDRILQRAKLNCIFIETCATFDIHTPLHLKENRGWRTGHCFEAAGWEKIADEGRLRIWQKKATENRVSTSLVLCTARTVSLPTHRSIIHLLTHDLANTRGWRSADAAESGLLRARNVAAARWWTDTADDVLLLVDDDIEFAPESAERIVDLCRTGYDIIAAAYPVRDGGHLAVRALDSSVELSFGPGLEPREMWHVSTGFLAIHRKVFDVMMHTVPLCHANQPWAFWPIFDFQVIEDEEAGGHNWLSEDYGFCNRARELGFKIWLDPTIKLQHLAQVPVSINNMGRIAEAIKHV